LFIIGARTRGKKQVDELERMKAVEKNNIPNISNSQATGVKQFWVTLAFGL